MILRRTNSYNIQTPSEFFSSLLGSSCDREGQQTLHVKEGGREMYLFCSLAFSKIEFFYYHVRSWYYPFQEDPVTDEDRARLVAKITKYYTDKGWDVVIDRRRFCPHCNEILARSQYDNWPGGVCDFCEKQIDRFGRIVPRPVENEVEEPKSFFSEAEGSFFLTRRPRDGNISHADMDLIIPVNRV